MLPLDAATLPLALKCRKGNFQDTSRCGPGTVGSDRLLRVVGAVVDPIRVDLGLFPPSRTAEYYRYGVRWRENLYVRVCAVTYHQLSRGFPSLARLTGARKEPIYMKPGRRVIATSLLVGITLWTLPAASACIWTWDCNSRGGHCRQIPVCDTTPGGTPLRPLEMAPLPSPTTRPVPTPAIPLIGPHSCVPQYLCSGGICAWNTECE
jgi:hypothetical protein